MVNESKVTMEVQSTLEAQIREGQLEDAKLKEIRQSLWDNKTSDFSEDGQGTLWLGKQICVPNLKHIKELILKEAHDSAYSIHPDSSKMYKDLKTRYWWYGMKQDVAEYLTLCDTCQITATSEDPRMEMGKIRMDFIVGLPCTQARYDSIWVIVDHLTKVAHFIPIKTTYSSAKLVELYMSKIVCLHGVSKKIMSDRGSQFTSKFWEKLHEPMDTKLNFISAYHLRMDGQMERTNQILEDMLRACALKYGKSWDKSLPYAEFSYNNCYQASIEMAPFF
jgi:hypothetical protein